MEKENLTIIPGLGYHSFRREDPNKCIVNFMSKFFNVHYFEWNPKSKLKTISDDLSLFYKENEITSSNFLTVSFGAVVFREFYNNGREIGVKKVVQIGPLNSGCKVLEKMNRFFPNHLEKSFGEVHKEFLQNRQKIFNLDLPDEMLIIAGNKRIDDTLTLRNNLDYFLLPFLINNAESDGKVFLNETTTKETQNIKIFPKSHYALYRDLAVLETAKNYLMNINP